MSSIDPSNPKQASASDDTASIAFLDQALWRRLIEATTPATFATAWLTMQVSMLKNVNCGVVVLGEAERGPYVPVGAWPEADSMPASLTRAAESAMAERRGIVHRASEVAHSRATSSQLAYPLLVDGRLFGVVALEFSDVNEADLQALMRQLQWGCGWFESYLRRGQQDDGSGETKERLSRLLELTATALSHDRFRAAAMAIVTELSSQLGCDRVGLGFRNVQQTKIYALSHTAQFGEQTNLVRLITDAMDEALDQLDTVVYPPENADRLVTRAHANLAEMSGAKAICTVMISSGDNVLGALSFERSTDIPFDRKTVDLLEQTAALLGPVLEMKRRDDRLLISKAAESARTLVTKFVGPKHYATKLIGLVVVTLFIILSLGRGDYRVTAEAVLEGAVQRSMVAPVNGYILEAEARAGDLVKQDQMLFSIDDRDLRLEFLKWSSQKEPQ
jgi:GAF domain-containing protein